MASATVERRSGRPRRLSRTTESRARTWRCGRPTERLEDRQRLRVTTPYALPFSVRQLRQRAQCMILTLALRSSRARASDANTFSRRLAALGGPGGVWSPVSFPSRPSRTAWAAAGSRPCPPGGLTKSVISSCRIGLRSETRRGGRFRQKSAYALNRRLTPESGFWRRVSLARSTPPPAAGLGPPSEEGGVFWCFVAPFAPANQVLSRVRDVPLFVICA